MAPAPALRPPLQKRSRKTLARIVDAGLAILREGGPGALTVQSVVGRARTSTGSFYQRFAGKEELLRHLEGVVVADAVGRFTARLADSVPPDAALPETIGAIVALLDEQPAPAPTMAAGAEIEAGRADAVAARLAARAREIGHPDPGAAVRIGYAAVSGALRARLPGVSASRLVPELARLWCSYLTGGAPEAPKGGAVDFFEVWG